MKETVKSKRSFLQLFLKKTRKPQEEMLDDSKSSNTISKDTSTHSLSKMVTSEPESPSSPPLEAELTNPNLLQNMTILQELMETWVSREEICCIL